MENNTINTSAQPQVQSTTSAPVSNNQGGAKKSSSILTIIFLITTLGFAGAFAWAMMRDNGGKISGDKSDAKCVVTQDQVDSAEEGTIGEIVANYDSEKEVKEVIDGLVKYLGSNGNGNTVSPQPQSMTYNSGSVIVKLDDGSYATTDKSFGFVVSPVSFEYVTPYETETETFMSNSGFTKNTELSTDYRNVYDKDDIRCDASIGVSPFSLVCSKTSWIKEENLELAKTLKEAYVAGGGQYGEPNYIRVNSSDIETSSNGNYERIRATIASPFSPVGGAYLLFYREVGASEWTFVTAGNGIPRCSEFDSAAGEAYAGTGLGCIDENDNVKKVGE